MGYAVELYFDAESTAQILALAKRIYQRCGGLDLAGQGFRPHISLASYSTIELARLEPVLRAEAERQAVLPITLSAIGVFPTEQGVVYLAPVVTEPLLALHRHFYAQALASGHVSHPYYQPGHWVPHCTVAHDLTPEGAAEAVRSALQHPVVRTGTLIEVGLIEYRPVRTLTRHALKSTSLSPTQEQ